MKLKTFNITFWPDPDKKDESVTIAYEAEDMQAATAKFLEEYPDQEGKMRETHSPLSNYEVDRHNEKEKTQDSPSSEVGLFDKLFEQVSEWAKMLTGLFIGLIGLGVVTSVLFGVDGGFGMMDNIRNLLADFNGLSGLIVVFLIYYLFIRSGKEEKT